MKTLILGVLLAAPAAQGQIMNSEQMGLRQDIQEKTSNIGSILSTLMSGVEKDDKAVLQKKLDVIKAAEKDMGEENLLRLELAGEVQKLQLSMQFSSFYGGNASEAALRSKLDALTNIETALMAHIDKNALKGVKEKAESGRVKGMLSSLRSALQVYYGDTEGTFPPDLATLTVRAKYITGIPAITPPGHKERSNAVKLVSGVKNMAELSELVDDAGGWLYVSDKASPMWGTVVINCSHADVGVNKPKMYTY